MWVENHVPECLLTTNLKTPKYTDNIKSLVLVITSLTFLISGAICSQLSVLPVFAAPKHTCFDGPHCLNRVCTDTLNGRFQCCWTDVSDGETVCQTCDINTDTGEFENCGDVDCITCSKGLSGSDIIAPSPSGVAPPPPPGPGQGGPGNVLPEGVFEGPTTPPQQKKITPEIAPLPPTCPPGQVLDEDTNLCFRAPKEQEEQQQPEVTEEEQPIPVCQEGLEFNEDLGFCVPTECPEGQELNEQAGICVLEEQPIEQQQQATEESEEQPEPDEEQPSEESDSEEENSDN